MNDNKAREELLCKLREVNHPSNWKIVLDLNEGRREITVSFYKKKGFGITIKEKMYYIFSYWLCTREICGFDYEDVLYKINKYPELLETEVVLNGKVSNE